MNLSDDWRARSPFMTESHHEWALTVRKFVQREVAPNIDAWESARAIPPEIQRKAGEIGILGLGFPEEYGGTSEGIDIFHHLVQGDELARAGAGGFTGSLTVHTVGVPTLLDGASEEIKQRVIPEILSGEKVMSLGLTEPSGGSDVAAYKATAVRDGDHYVLNGVKTFNSNGMRADYVLFAARTGGPGADGLSLFLVDTSSPGFSRTKLEKMGFHCQDTATIYLENVRVPARNMVGPENQGFRAIVKGTNYERLTMSQNCCSYARVCLEEAATWAQQRETFGRKLGQHQVIRVKLANMTRMIEATQAFVERCAWQYQNGMERPADFAMLKVQATQMFEAVAREAAQVLGGASVLLGSKVERLYREVRIHAVGGGSEEILLDFAGRRLGYG